MAKTAATMVLQQPGQIHDNIQPVHGVGTGHIIIELDTNGVAAALLGQAGLGMIRHDMPHRQHRSPPEMVFRLPGATRAQFQIGGVQEVARQECIATRAAAADFPRHRNQLVIMALEQVVGVADRGGAPAAILPPRSGMSGFLTRHR